MPWYKSGTVSVVQNSNAVIGAGTAFIANARVGDAFRGPDGGWYEVANIASDTALSIAPVYQGATNSSGVYALAPMQGYVKDSADALRALVNQFGGVMAVLGQTATQAGVRASLNLTNTDGLPEGATNKYMSAGGVRSTAITGLDLTVKTALVATDTVLAAFGKLQAQITAAAAVVIGQGYIEGLRPVWNSNSSISVTSGAAFIPGLGKTLTVSSTLTYTFATGSLPAMTFHYLYLYEDAGVAKIELSTIAPTTYSGTAKTKTADTSRRFLCAVKSGSGGGLVNFRPDGDVLMYEDSINAAPYRVVNASGATTPVAVNISAVCPPSSSVAVLNMQNSSANANILWLTSVASPGLFIQGTDQSSRQRLRVVLDASRFSFFLTATGGTAYVDVAGYSFER